MTNTTQPQPAPVDTKIVQWYLVAGLTYFAIALLAGFLFSLQFLQHYPFPGVELLSPGRIRMLHTNGVAYGFILNCFLGALHWVVPRLTRHPVASKTLSWMIFWAVQAIVVATVIGITAGRAQAVEWGETPIWVDPFVVVGLILMGINFSVPILKASKQPLYVSLWYFSVAFIWTTLNYIMGNFIPQYFTPGASGAAIVGLFIHDLVGLLVTPIGWGLMYYFVPTILKKPVWSHAVSLIGFWGLAFFYPLQGVHHFFYSTIPMFAQYSAVVSTIGIEVVVMTVFINFMATIRGRADAFKILPLRWFYTGIVLYMVTCAQCAYQALLTTQQIIHFTDWVVGHAHLVMFGVFGFWILGIVTELWPRLTGKPWHKPSLNTAHYWLTTVGMVIMFVDLLAAGVMQGYLWRALAPWEESLLASMPFWWWRSASGTLIIIGQILFFYNLWRTASAPAPATSPSTVPEPVTA
jgi:cytochrome c oxidase cbb3-type subunit 1